MVTIVVNKLLFILFFLSLVNVLRHSLLFLIKVSDQEKYRVSNTTLFYLGLSLSMLLTSLFTGIKI